MTEEEARKRVSSTVPRETLQRLEQFIALVLQENQRQNLVAPSTISNMWVRHILDSAQLAWLAAKHPGLWLDIGSGAGFPGIVAGLIRSGRTVLLEPRAKRAAFLRNATSLMHVDDRIEVVAMRVESFQTDPPAVISARAVAPLPILLALACRHAAPETLWLLPKGQSAAIEVAEARREWQGEMQLVPSLSDPDSAIVVARGLKRGPA